MKKKLKLRPRLFGLAGPPRESLTATKDVFVIKFPKVLANLQIKLENLP